MGVYIYRKERRESGSNAQPIKLQQSFITCSSRAIYIYSALFRNLRFLQKVLRFLGIPRKHAIL